MSVVAVVEVGVVAASDLHDHRNSLTNFPEDSCCQPAVTARMTAAAVQKGQPRATLGVVWSDTNDLISWRCVHEAATTTTTLALSIASFHQATPPIAGFSIRAGCPR